MRNLVTSACLLLGATLLATGCSQTMPPNKAVVAVKGRVVFANNEPVRWATINLRTKDVNVTANAFGRVDGDGNFELRTYSSKQPDGAVPGDYDLHLSDYNRDEVGDLPADAAKPTPIPPGSTDGIIVTIPQSGTSSLVITLKN